MRVRHDAASPTTIAVVDTGFGPVEVAHRPGDGAAVLFFPGGHCDAATPAGADLYAKLGHEVLSFSRPGYGRIVAVRSAGVPAAFSAGS